MLGLFMWVGTMTTLGLGVVWLLWLKDNRPHYFMAVMCLIMGGVLLVVPRLFGALGILPQPTSYPVAPGDFVASFDQITSQIIQYGPPIAAVLLVVCAIIHVLQGVSDKNRGQALSGDE